MIEKLFLKEDCRVLDFFRPKMRSHIFWVDFCLEAECSSALVKKKIFFSECTRMEPNGMDNAFGKVISHFIIGIVANHIRIRSLIGNKL